MPMYEYYVDPRSYDTDNYNGAERVAPMGQPADYFYLPLAVYLPDTPGEYPVIVFSHGAGGDYLGADDLAAGYATIQGLTAAGYIVIAPTHADSNRAEGTTYQPQYLTPATYPGATSADAVKFAFRADDVALAINFLQSEAATNLRQPNGAGLPTGATTGYSIDLDAPIVAVGHSYGSNTVVLLAGADIYQSGTGHFSIPVNSDIDAVVSLSGTGIGGEPIFDAASFNGAAGGVALPYLRLSGWNDLTADVADVGDRYEPYFLTEEDRPSTTWAVDIDGATHAQFVNPDGDKDGVVTAAEEARFATVLDAIVSFVDYYVRGDGAALTSLEALDLDDPANYDLDGGSQTLTLGSGDDLYFAYNGDDSVAGGDGDDALYGMAGDDSLFGGAGNDLLAGGPGQDEFIGGNGDDIYFVDDAGDSVVDVSSGALPTTGGFDTVYAGVNYVLGFYIDKLVLTGDDTLSGDGYGTNAHEKSDIIIGNDGANVLRGWGGEDSLDGGKGDDTVIGGAHDDTVTGGVGNDRVEGGDGQDDLDGGIGADTLIGGAGYDVIIEYDTPNGGSDYVDGGDGRDLINAGVANDTVFGGGDNDTINEAGHGDDTLHGDAGDDIIMGDGDGDTEGGHDLLTGDDGADTLDGRLGDDTLDGGAGADSLVGGGGDDDFYVDAAGDVVLEAAAGGIDRVLSTISYTLPGEVEDLALLGTAANGVGNALDNWMNGNGSANVLVAGNGADTVSGSGGADEVYGGNGDDIVYGNDDNDTVVGGAGADTLDGGAGVDRLTGGANDDTFVFVSAAEIGNGGGARDIITDFNNTSEDDRIHLAAVDAVTGGSDNAFTFIGTSSFSSTAGELRYFTLLGNTYVTGDTDGNGFADFTIQLTGALTLTSGDFVL